MSLGTGATKANRCEKRFVREEISTSTLRSAASTGAVALKQLNGTTIKKSPYLFLLYFESMYYKYLPCQILIHDFDEKSDFLNYEFSIRLPAVTQFKNGRVQKRELGRGTMWFHPIKTSKQACLLEYAEEECEVHVLSFFVCFCLRLPWERLCYGAAVFSWLDNVTRRPLIQIITGRPFGDLSNGGRVSDKFTWAISSQ